MARRYPADVDDPRVERWANSGAMALTGLSDEPLGPPEGLVEGVAQLGRNFPGLDTLALLGERAALMGLWRRGATSCGGSCRLLPCSDEFMAVSLPRLEDMEMVPAWLELDVVPASAPATWSAVAAGLREGDAGALHQRALLLGLPVARVGETTPSNGLPARAGVIATRLGEAAPRPDVEGAVVVDLSALWAGPLCGDLLARSGASVIKVESTQRPDGARRGARSFFDLLNGRKRSVALDLETLSGVRILQALVQRADIVIEASRPRALAQFGLDAHDAVSAGGPQVWVSITGHGRSGGDALRIAFGDDAAAAGGLGDPDTGRSTVLRRRRRRPAHRPLGGRRLYRDAPLRWTLAPRSLHGCRQRRARRTHSSNTRRPRHRRTTRRGLSLSRHRSSEPIRHRFSPTSASRVDRPPAA